MLAKSTKREITPSKIPSSHRVRDPAHCIGRCSYPPLSCASNGNKNFSTPLIGKFYSPAYLCQHTDFLLGWTTIMADACIRLPPVARRNAGKGRPTDRLLLPYRELHYLPTVALLLRPMSSLGKDSQCPSIDLSHLCTVRNRIGLNCPYVAATRQPQSRGTWILSQQPHTHSLSMTGLPVRCGSYRSQRIRSLTTGMVRPDVAPTCPNWFVPRYSFRQYSACSSICPGWALADVSRNHQITLRTLTVVSHQLSIGKRGLYSLSHGFGGYILTPRKALCSVNHLPVSVALCLVGSPFQSCLPSIS